MSKNPFAPPLENLPATLAIFPLTGVLLLPRGHLPLNIFEPRYLRMVSDAMAGSRMIGMVQPRMPGGGPEKPAVYDIGCAGKITDFTETEDGRFLITLTGICRFRIERELDVATPYRQITPDWSAFAHDVGACPGLDIDREKLKGLLKSYFTAQGLSCDWEKVDDAPDDRLMTCLSMVCPFEAKEKQALLEAPCGRTRAEMFMAMLQIAVHEAQQNRDAGSKH